LLAIVPDLSSSNNGLWSVFLVKLCSSMGRRLGVVVVVEIACTLSK